MASCQDFGEGDSHLFLNVCPEEAVCFETLRDEVCWHTMLHRGGPVPRLVAVQGDVLDDGSYPVYRHPAEQQPRLVPWTPSVEPLRRAAERIVGHRLNHALIQWYRGGADNISEHADKTLDILRGSCIVNFSLGATRTMVLRHKGPGKQQMQRARLLHNSLFVLGWETNRSWTHAVNKDGRADRDKAADELAYGSHRISFTFRRIATFRSLTGSLSGQGVPASPEAACQQQELVEMLKAFSAENKTPQFEWEPAYGTGFSVYNIEEVAGSGGRAAPSRRTALLAIDLQNDFLSSEPACFMARRGVEMGLLQAVLPPVASVASELRRAGAMIVWVRAVYGGWEQLPAPHVLPAQRGGLPANDELHASTHKGAATCCVRGSFGAEPYAEAARLVEAGDFVLEKRWYSCFTETPLHALLQARGVDRLVLCGVTTHMCVQACAVDAFHLGYEVVLLEDACVASSPKLQQQGLAAMEPYVARATSSELLRRFPCAPVRTHVGKRMDLSGRLSGFGAGDCVLVPNFLPREEADELLRQLLPDGGELAWSQLSHTKHGFAFPRLCSFQAERNSAGHLPVYRCADPQPWHGQYHTEVFTPSVARVRRAVEAAAGHGFNWCRLLLYRHSGDGMGFHSDKCLDLRVGSCIASLTLGQSREYEIKPKCADGPAPQQLQLQHNTLLLLGPETNRRCLHALRKGKGQQGPRISVTLRDVATFYAGGSVPRQHDFYGQGTRLATFESWQQHRRWRRAAVAAATAASAAVAAAVAPHWRLAAAVAAAAAGSGAWELWQRRQWRSMGRRLERVFEACNQRELSPLDARELLWSLEEGTV